MPAGRPPTDDDDLTTPTHQPLPPEEQPEHDASVAALKKEHEAAESPHSEN